MTNFIKTLSLSLLVGNTTITYAIDKMTIPQSQNASGSSSIMLEKKTVKREYDLKTTLDLFETKQWKDAYKSFKRIGEAGGIVGSTYMTYMEKMGYVDPSIVHGHVIVESIPEIGQDLSNQYLKASLAYMEPEMAAKVKQLAPLILNHNAHAVSLMYKLCEEDSSAFSLLLKMHGFKRLSKKYEPVQDLFKNFVPSHEPVVCWNCLEPDYLVYLHKNIRTSRIAKAFTLTELNYFVTNYEKAPHLFGKLARKLATINDLKKVNQPLFWAHLALENGLGDLCGQLGKSFYDQSRTVTINSKEYKDFQKKQSTVNVSLSSEKRDCLELSRYYTYNIQKNDLLSPKKVISLIQEYGGAYEMGTYGNPDKLKSYYFDQKAAELGDSTSQYNVAIRLRDGDGIEKNSRKAIHYFKLADQQNNVDAQFNLGIMYRDGGWDRTKYRGSSSLFQTCGK